MSNSIKTFDEKHPGKGGGKSLFPGTVEIEPGVYVSTTSSSIFVDQIDEEDEEDKVGHAEETEPSRKK